MARSELAPLVDQALRGLSGGDEFEHLCKDILMLLGPKRIVSRTGPGGEGRDLDVYFGDVTNEAQRTRPVGIWWVECKKRGDSSLGPAEIAPSFFFLLTKEGGPPPPPDALLYMTTTHLSNPMMDRLNNVRIDDVYLGHVKGEDIRDILLDNPQLLCTHFPEFESRFEPNELTNKGLHLRRVVVSGIERDRRAVNTVTFRKGETTPIEVTVKNLTAGVLDPVEFDVRFPPGIIAVPNSAQYSTPIEPFETRTIRFSVVVESGMELSTHTQILPTFRSDESTEVQYEITTLEYQNTVHLPLVGREDQLQALEDALSTRPSVILVEGEPGVGKSRFWEEGLLRLRDTPQTVWVLPSDATAHPRNLLRTVSNALLEPWDIPIQNPLARSVLDFKIKKRLGRADKQFVAFLMGEDTLDPHRLKHFISQLGELITSDRTVNHVFVVDDVHALSPSTMEYLELVIRELSNKVSFVLSYRVSEIRNQTRQTLLELSTDVIFLDKLREGLLSEGLRRVADVAPPDEAFLEHRASGVPFHFVESIRLLEEVDWYRFNDAGRLFSPKAESCCRFPWPAATGVDDMHAIAIQRFEAVLKNNPGKELLIERLVALAAAMGRPLRLSLVENWFGEEVVPILDELVRRRLLRLEQESFVDEQGIDFIHDRVAEAIRARYEDQAVLWARTNRDLADCLVRFSPPNSLTDDSRKISECYGIAGDKRSQLKYLLVYFEHCVQLDHFSEVIQQGHVLIALMDEVSKITGDLVGHPQRAYVLLRMGITAHWQRKPVNMNDYFDRSLDCAVVSHRQLSTIRVFRTTSAMLCNPTSTEQLMADLDEQLDRLRTVRRHTPESLEAFLQALKYSHLFHKLFRGDYAEAEAFLTEAIEVCRKHGHQRLLLWNQLNQGTMKLFQDETARNRLDFAGVRRAWEEALDHWSAVLEAAEESRIVEHIIEGNSTTGFTKMFLGFHDRDELLIDAAMAHFRRSYRFAKLFEHKYWECKLLNHFGVHAALRRDFGEAMTNLEKGLVLAHDQKNYFTAFVIRQNMANVEFETNGPREAAAQWRLGLTIALDSYFPGLTQALANYQFRIFLRGLLIHSLRYPEADAAIKTGTLLRKAILDDEGLLRFISLCQRKASNWLDDYDCRAFNGCYYATH